MNNLCIYLLYIYSTYYTIPHTAMHIYTILYIRIYSMLVYYSTGIYHILYSICYIRLCMYILYYTCANYTYHTYHMHYIHIVCLHSLQNASNGTKTCLTPCTVLYLESPAFRIDATSQFDLFGHRHVRVRRVANFRR